MGLKKHRTTKETAQPRFIADKLKQLKIGPSSKFEAIQYLLKEEKAIIEDNREGIKEALTSTCQDVLGLKNYHH
ncbi:unnamed protein product [Schistosoma margrebowiei]|uniref:Uncharacterized protein n=1 Tax=Schistosoma margrebowiei TaxID=48269 RepID=A0A183M485_9TREM|nr:unnamed protein product [Schistosoma margrebowiei]